MAKPSPVLTNEKKLDGAAEARRAHNPEVTRSKRVQAIIGFFFGLLPFALPTYRLYHFTHLDQLLSIFFPPFQNGILRTQDHGVAAHSVGFRWLSLGADVARRICVAYLISARNEPGAPTPAVLQRYKQLSRTSHAANITSFSLRRPKPNQKAIHSHSHLTTRT